MDGWRENGEKICYKLVFVSGKGVADVLQKMAERGEDRKEWAGVLFTSRPGFVQSCRLI